MTHPAAIALVSGGLDSMVSAARAREQGFAVLALTIDYGQRHRIELEAAARVAERIGAAAHVVLPLDLRAFGGSALTADIDVPKGGVGDDVPVTYVPARNTIFLSLALGWAEAAGSPGGPGPGRGRRVRRRRTAWAGSRPRPARGRRSCRRRRPLP